MSAGNFSPFSKSCYPQNNWKKQLISENPIVILFQILYIIYSRVVRENNQKKTSHKLTLLVLLNLIYIHYCKRRIGISSIIFRCVIIWLRARRQNNITCKSRNIISTTKLGIQIIFWYVHQEDDMRSLILMEKHRITRFKFFKPDVWQYVLNNYFIIILYGLLSLFLIRFKTIKTLSISKWLKSRFH